MSLKSKLVALTLATTLLLASVFYFSPPVASACEARWENEVTDSLLDIVRADLARAERQGCKVLRVHLISPGGSVIAGLEIAREMRLAQARGLIMEVHGSTFVVSMATVLLAAGSPGHRYVNRNVITLIHGVSRRGSCFYLVEKPADEDEHMGNQIILTMASVLSELTMKPKTTTLEWLRCGKPQAGNGQLLKDLGFADHLEP